MSDEDDFDLDDELERELEAGMDVDEGVCPCTSPALEYTYFCLQKRSFRHS